ncbi:hypothetical protein OG2516_12316 [Oceanicola granulosus HTCC2516]|uniref:Uncharacterized protein n=1 Tax=Oceanicola granulosus (strain ATCC BAA-861 / DSM 15982 / KCTC 12143 / HTCC2516) TaxID=314256 RepID=Q2CD45_OCEGH|nr:DUF6478 family protein [Oceanicola granulosus]EAR50633.1 hypothetical protein OG2516_12316 [Oceanicola granulosus HTCC2516]
MAGKDGPIERTLHRATMVRWRRAARQAWKTSLPVLRRRSNAARALRQHLDELLHVAGERLAMPRIGSDAFPRPHGTDWSWRPQLWRGPLPVRGRAGVPSGEAVGDEVTVFHDCTISELTVRQLRNQREADLAPYGLRLDVFRFDGSFLSVVLDLPPDAAANLRKRHLLRLDAIVETEYPLEIFARLNIRHGPNTEQVLREIPAGSREVTVEFDVAYTKLNEKRAEKLWIDLIFENPEMNQITIRDLTFCRYPRAEL